MSIATEIQRLQLAKEDIKSAIIEKGGTVEEGALIDTYGEAIRGIEVGGSDSYYDTFWGNIYEQIKKSTFRIFNGSAWNDKTFQPPSNTVITMTQDARYAFSAMQVKNMKSCLDDRGVKIDFTNIKFSGGIFTDNGELEHLGEIDLSTLVNEVDVGDMFQRCGKLVTVDKIKFCEKALFKGQPFNNCSKLENVTFEGELKLSISFVTSPLLSDASIQNIIDCLSDLTGQTAQTITFHADVKAKLTDEQIATITSKNWTLA